jgi:hypothetical protein
VVKIAFRQTPVSGKDTVGGDALYCFKNLTRHYLTTNHLVSSPTTRGTEMLPRLQWTPDWMEVYQAEEAPGLDIPAHEIVKSASQDC